MRGLPDIMPLNILCVTNNPPHALGLLRHLDEQAYLLDSPLVIACDGNANLTALARHYWKTARLVCVTSRGYIESALDAALLHCWRDYVLRVDDDEELSEQLVDWLATGVFVDKDVWSVGRAWLWPDHSHYITSAWPDWQTRLARRSMSGQRTMIHQGSPYGYGQPIDQGWILHHKLLVRSYEERCEDVLRYEALQSGAGEQTRHFYLPEDHNPPTAPVSALAEP